MSHTIFQPMLNVSVILGFDISASLSLIESSLLSDEQDISQQNEIQSVSEATVGVTQSSYENPCEQGQIPSVGIHQCQCKENIVVELGEITLKLNKIIEILNVLVQNTLSESNN